MATSADTGTEQAVVTMLLVALSCGTVFDALVFGTGVAAGLLSLFTLGSNCKKM